MFDHLLESSHRDDSNKSSNIGFGEEMTEVVSIDSNYMHLIWSDAPFMPLQTQYTLYGDA